MASGYSSPSGQSTDNSWIFTSSLETPERSISQDQLSSPHDDWMFVKSVQTPETQVARKLPSKIVENETITKRPRGENQNSHFFLTSFLKQKQLLKNMAMKRMPNGV